LKTVTELHKSRECVLYFLYGTLGNNVIIINEKNHNDLGPAVFIGFLINYQSCAIVVGGNSTPAANRRLTMVIT